MFHAACNNFSVISRRFQGKLPVLLVHSSWHSDSVLMLTSHPWAPRRAAITTILEYLLWPGQGSNQRLSEPKQTLYPYTKEAVCKHARGITGHQQMIRMHQKIRLCQTSLMFQIGSRANINYVTFMAIKSRSSSKLDYMGSKTCSLNLILWVKHNNNANRQGGPHVSADLNANWPEHYYQSHLA